MKLIQTTKKLNFINPLDTFKILWYSIKVLMILCDFENQDLSLVVDRL